ncbi:MAG: hypothetical protein AB1679_12820 [Actinomycetota bacterium]|jgi:hypothetical protein
MRRAVRLGIVAGPATAQVMVASPARAALPGAGIVTDAIGGASGWAFDTLASGVAGWVVGAVAYFADGVLNFLKTSGRPQVDAAWFAGPGSPLATVRNLAGVLMAGFVLLGLLQGLVRGDPGAMVRRLAADVPVAVLGIVATVAVTGKLLDLTDALSTAVLDSSHGEALRFLSRFAVLAAGTQGFAVVVVGLLAIVAALVLWVELMVRSALVYLLVAVSPIAFAAMVWPAARGVLRRTAHLLLAVIFSKFVIAVALAVGVAALGGASGTSEAAVGTAMLGAVGPAPGNSDPAVGLGALLVGAVILALAAFAPFIVLRLIPIAEAALVAQGVSRGPLRAAQSGLGTYYYTNSISRLGGATTQGAQPAPAVTGPSPTPLGGTGGATPATPGVATTPGAGTATGAGAAGVAATAARSAGQQVTATAHRATAAAPSDPPAPATTDARREGVPPDHTRRTP